MTKYIFKRVLLAIFTIWLVATLTFFLMHLVPGGPFTAEKSISKTTQAALEAKYNLDKPLGERYLIYMNDLLHNDMGPSIKQRGYTVAQIISTRFPVSATLGGLSTILALCVGIPMGSIAALNRGKPLDHGIIVVATGGIAVPSFVLCTLLMYWFGVHLKWLPTGGITSAASYILPVLALSFYPTAYITRLMRSSMLDVLGQDYMRTAKSKGLSSNKILFKHALRNAILPIVTYVGPMLAYTIAGSFVVEKIFSIPGLGGQFVTSITTRDYPVIMGTTIFLATLLIGINVLVDICYKLIDPRITLQ